MLKFNDCGFDNEFLWDEGILDDLDKYEFVFMVREFKVCVNFVENVVFVGNWWKNI